MLIGTPMYMAPELARGGDQRATTAVDVYSLGVMLYELITGRPPFDGDLASVLRAVLEAEPVSPRELAPTVPRELEAICLKCIEKLPSARYRTAEALADDLDRFVRGDPVTARRANLADRAWRFTQRHRVAVGGGLGTLLLLAVVAATAISVAHTQELELQRDMLRTNAYAAHALAGAVAFHLREQIDAVVATATDPRVARLVPRGDDAALERLRIHTRFDSISVFDRSGAMLAHAPARPGQIGLDYSWRNYFIGASELGKAGQRAGYISRAFLSESDDSWKFGVAAPLYDGDTWTGVVMATIGTDSSLGKLHLHDEGNADRAIVVVAPQDRSRTDPDIAGRYVVILHDTLPHGAGIPIDSPRLQELRLTSTGSNQLSWIDPVPITDDTHRDPLPRFEGRWLAGFAPVGKTGFVVIVQTRYDTAIAPNARLSRRLLVRVGAVILAWSVVFSAGLWGHARRRRQVRTLRRGSSLAVSPTS